MKSKIINTALRGLLLSVSCFIGSANATLIFSEDFTGGDAALLNSPIVTWSDSDGGGFEVYNTGGAGARGMSGMFDHDNDPSTPQIVLPGALEVNDDSGNVSLTATFNLDTAINANQMGFLSFFGGVRGGNAVGASVEIFNLTQNASISGLLTPTLGAYDWAYNEFSFASTAANVGDQIQFRWQGGGTNSANGQEVALVSFSIVDGAAVVPEPSTIVILALGIIGLASRRFKQQF
ncbi:MAG: PEP-CTERM sorting domain-containing protein [Cognaticolwellia sp.]